MDNESVRKDVFDAELRRVEETFGGAIQNLRDRIDDQKERIAYLRDSIIRGWTVLGVLAAIAAIVFAGVHGT